jgi:hypothetical protein
MVQGVRVTAVPLNSAPTIIIVGDEIDPSKPTNITKLLGDRADFTAKNMAV